MCPTLIVLSVLVGLAISEWRQGRADRALAAAALENCRLELRDNLARLEAVLPIHREVQTELRAVLAQGDEIPSLMALMREIMPQGGMQLPALKEVAWETAISTGAIRHRPERGAAPGELRRPALSRDGVDARVDPPG